MVATARLLLCFVLGLSGLFGVATMACAPGAAGERPAAPENPATTVLRCARLIDGTGGKVVDDAVVVIVGEKILAAGPRATTPIPSGAQIVVYEGKTIMPGIISDHSHVGIVNGVDVGAASYSRSNILRQLRQYEAYGVTTVTALGLNGALFEPIRAEMHTGKTPGADLFGVDRGIGVPDGAPPAGLLPVGPDQLFRPATPEQAREAVQAMASRQTDLVKLWLDDFGGSVPSKMKPEIYDAVIDESHKHGLRVAAHIHDLDDAKAILRAGADILAHGVRDKPVDSEFLAEMKSREAFYVATLSLDEATFVYADGPAWMKDPFFQHATTTVARSARRPGLARQGGERPEVGRGPCIPEHESTQSEGGLRCRRRGRLRHGLGCHACPHSWICGASRAVAHGPGGAHTDGGAHDRHASRGRGARAF